nr:Chain E, NP-N5D peptide [synthetic construct]4L8D_F Chain F, NP-N5D peptide [synthetic construct]
ASNEDMETM